MALHAVRQLYFRMRILFNERVADGTECHPYRPHKTA